MQEFLRGSQNRRCDPNAFCLEGKVMKHIVVRATFIFALLPSLVALYVGCSDNKASVNGHEGVKNQYTCHIGKKRCGPFVQ